MGIISLKSSQYKISYYFLDPATIKIPLSKECRFRSGKTGQAITASIILEVPEHQEVSDENRIKTRHYCIQSCFSRPFVEVAIGHQSERRKLECPTVGECTRCYWARRYCHDPMEGKQIT